MSDSTPSDIITKLRKEIGGADPGTIYGDVLELCAAYEELAIERDQWRAAAMEHGAEAKQLRTELHQRGIALLVASMNGGDSE